ncbi:MAG: hypothetical protein U0744_09455 [Gemmataceae bacterium]
MKSDSPFASIDEIKAKRAKRSALGGSAAQQLLDERKIETVLYEEQEGILSRPCIRPAAGGRAARLSAPSITPPEKKVKFGRNMEGVKMQGSPFA